MTSVTEISVRAADGRDATLGDYAGKVLLVVNVASKCGLTPQYDALQKLYEQYRGKGFEVLGFPANDFAGQEPGTDEEIQAFCSTEFGVEFPVFSKISVAGPAKHPLYQELTRAAPITISKPGTDMRAQLRGYGMEPNPEPEVLWNFEKFLVGRDGAVVGRFSPDMAPDDPILLGAIDKALGSDAHAS